MTQLESYYNGARELLDKAFKELDEGDMRQASEKGWGAAAQSVKAVAETRGWPHQGHAQLFLAVSKLAEETGDTQLGNLFHVASSLHTNFYENWLTEELVKSGLEDVRRFVEALQPLVR